jgi:hypothetical protein
MLYTLKRKKQEGMIRVLVGQVRNLKNVALIIKHKKAPTNVEAS